MAAVYTGPGLEPGVMGEPGFLHKCHNPQEGDGVYLGA